MQRDYGKDEGDRANTSFAHELDLGQKSRDRALLTAVEAALKRITEGTIALFCSFRAVRTRLCMELRCKSIYNENFSQEPL